MGIILLQEYAERHRKNPVVAAQRAARGAFLTARKIGRQWFIDENEPWRDSRVKTGRYVNARRRGKQI